MNTSTTPKRVLINHGWDSQPDAHWFSWLERELKDRGFEVYAPQFPGGEHPKKEEWVNLIAETIMVPDANTYSVGHSLGCLSIARYLEQLPFDVVVGGCVFVAGFYEDLGEPQIANFVTPRLDFDLVTMHSKNFVSIVSKNDDAVPLDKATNFQRRLGAELILETAGHFCADDGVIYLEPALQAILKMAA